MYATLETIMFLCKKQQLRVRPLIEARAVDGKKFCDGDIICNGCSASDR